MTDPVIPRPVRGAEIVLPQPAPGPVPGARVLAEFGDDPTRYTGAEARKNYAGTSPITRASGKRKGAPARFTTGTLYDEATARSHHAESLAA